MTKVCNKCGIEKDVGLFNKNKRMNDGISKKCRYCTNIDRVIYDRINRERLNKQKKEWLEKQNDEYKEKKRETIMLWAINNKDRIKENRNAWREKNRDRTKVYGTLSRLGIKSQSLPKELMDIMVTNQALKSLIKNRKEGVRHENEQRLLQKS